MSTLKEKGPEAVVSWTEEKGINIFEKKFVFIPVNAGLHWTLVVIVNPGQIANHYNSDLPATEDHSSILFFDSLKDFHNKSVNAKHIRQLLNSEHKRLGCEKVGDRSDPFDCQSIPMASSEGMYFNFTCFIIRTGAKLLSHHLSNSLSSPAPR
jgi:Ulp1 family protease